MPSYTCKRCGAKAESDHPVDDFYMHMRLAHGETYTAAPTQPKAGTFVRHLPPTPRRKTSRG